MTEKKILLTPSMVTKTINRLALEIIEAVPELSETVFIGIESGGVPLAERVAEAVKRFEDIDIPVGKLDISLHRDDLILKPEQVTVKASNIPFDINDKFIILFDDVVYSGRTIRAALDSLGDWGRPKIIKLAALIDRGYRQLPIEPNFVGKHIQADKHDFIETNLIDRHGSIFLQSYISKK